MPQKEEELYIDIAFSQDVILKDEESLEAERCPNLDVISVIKNKKIEIQNKIKDFLKFLKI